MSDIKQLIAKSLKSHTLIADIASYGLIKLGFADKYLAGLVGMYKSYHWLCKRFDKECDDFIASSVSSEVADQKFSAENKKAWVCWLQGMDNAPEIVKTCFESVRYWLKDWDITVITSDTYSDYTELPEHVVDMWKRGIITNTHFSDILRLDLLVRHGGLWLDATTFLTGPLPSYVTRNELFVYRNGWMDMDMIQMASWLIYSKGTENIILHVTRDLLYEYWRRYRYLKNYFLMHMFFRMVSDRRSNDWARVPYINQVDNHLLMQLLDKPFDAERVNQIKQITTIHKLTYKVNNDDEPSLTRHRLGELIPK